MATQLKRLLQASVCTTWWHVAARVETVTHWMPLLPAACGGIFSGLQETKILKVLARAAVSFVCSATCQKQGPEDGGGRWPDVCVDMRRSIWPNKRRWILFIWVDRKKMMKILANVRRPNKCSSLLLLLLPPSGDARADRRPSPHTVPRCPTMTPTILMFSSTTSINLLPSACLLPLRHLFFCTFNTLSNPPDVTSTTSPPNRSTLAARLIWTFFFPHF